MGNVRASRHTQMRWLAQIACVAALTGLAACGGGGGGIDNGDDTFVPNFTFVWDEIDGAGNFVSPVHQFVFLTDDATCKPSASNCSSGSLSDSSNEQLNGATNQIVSGSFNHHDMTFTVDRSGTRVAITARFNDADSIRLSEPGRTYTVRRNTNP